MQTNYVFQEEFDEFGRWYCKRLACVSIHAAVIENVLFQRRIGWMRNVIILVIQLPTLVFLVVDAFLFQKDKDPMECVFRQVVALALISLE